MLSIVNSICERFCMSIHPSNTRSHTVSSFFLDLNTTKCKIKQYGKQSNHAHIHTVRWWQSHAVFNGVPTGPWSKDCARVLGTRKFRHYKQQNTTKRPYRYIGMYRKNIGNKHSGLAGGQRHSSMFVWFVLCVGLYGCFLYSLCVYVFTEQWFCRAMYSVNN